MSRRASSAAKVAAPLKKVRAGEGDGVTGLDADGTRYGSAEELWAKEKKKGLKNWYGSAIEYWSTVPATVDGVLGGFGSVPGLGQRIHGLRGGHRRRPGLPHLG